MADGFLEALDAQIAQACAMAMNGTDEQARKAVLELLGAVEALVPILDGAQDHEQRRSVLQQATRLCAVAWQTVQEVPQ